MSKKRLISENNIVFLMNDMESLTDSEERDRLLQLQINKLNDKLNKVLKELKQ